MPRIRKRELKKSHFLPHQRHASGIAQHESACSEKGWAIAQLVQGERRGLHASIQNIDATQQPVTFEAQSEKRAPLLCG